MRFQLPVSVFLAFALAVLCYPFSGNAFADEVGFSGGHADNSPLLGGRAGSSGGLAGQAVEEGQKAVASHSGSLPAPGGGFAFAGDFFPAADYDDSRAVQADRVAGLNGRVGADSGADAQEQSEADLEGGEAVAEDPGRAEAEGFIKSVEALEGLEYENNEDSISDFDTFSGSGSSGLSEFQSDLSTGFDSLPTGGYTDGTADGQEYPEELEVSATPRAIPVFIQGASAVLGAVASATGILDFLKSNFGTGRETDGLLISLLSVSKYINDDTSAIYSRLGSIYSSLTGTISNRLLNIQNYSANLSKLVNIDASLSSILSNSHWNGYLSGQGTADFSVAALLARIFNSNYANFSWLGWFLHWEGYLPGFGQADFSLAALVERFYEVSRSGLSNVNSNLVWSGHLTGYGEGSFSAAALLNRIYEMSLSGFSNVNSNLVWSGHLTGYGEGSFSAAALLNRLYEMSRSRLGLIADYSVWHGTLSGHGEADFSSASILGRFYNLCAHWFPTLSSPSVNVEVGGDLLDKLLSGVNAIGSFLNPGSVVDGVTDVLGDLSEVPDMADSLIGDLKFDSIDALASNIGAVVSGKFPFSIPFVFLGILTIFEAPPAPPVFEFDIAGSPMVLDFSEYGGFAELSRFFCSFFFAVSLLVVSRRFIFFGGGSSAD